MLYIFGKSKKNATKFRYKKKISKAMTSNTVESSPCTDENILYALRVDFPIAKHDSRFELNQVLCFPATVVNQAFKICPKILDWTDLRHVCWVQRFWYNWYLVFSKPINHFFCIMWWSLVRPKHIFTIGMVFSKDWHKLGTRQSCIGKSTLSAYKIF